MIYLRFMKTSFFSLICLFCLSFGYAQIDNTFWFAVPEVAIDHGDSPTILRFSSFDKATTITISFPADLNIPPKTIALGANSSTSVDITDRKELIENSIPNVVSNKGMLISSTENITAYYEVNASNNPDIFALKGRNGLGLEFYTPFQNDLNNQFLRDFFGPNSTRAYSSIDIVAAENNTNVTITPSVNVEGHLAGIPFVVQLQKGQTYSVRSVDELAASHPAGTHIVSDKPIAVTIKDDSVVRGGAWDLIGDQLVPVRVLGDTYGLTFGTGYILAIENNTVIEVGGVVQTTLNKGDQYSVDVTQPVLVSGSSPFYLLQIGGIIDEIGGAVLPPLVCTGSKKIAVTQSVPNFLILMVVVKSGGADDFIIDGNSTAIKSSSFQSIGGGWVAAELDFSNVFDIEETIILENTTSDFHLGIRNGTGAGARFGYFSDFGVLDLGIDLIQCEGDDIRLDAGISKDTYLWNTGDTTQTINVELTGTYSVSITKGECSASDTIEVTVNQGVFINDLGPDQEICEGDSLIFTPSNNSDYNYLWQDLSTDSILVAKVEGQYTVEVSNNVGCFKKDTVEISVVILPNVELGSDTIICNEIPLTLMVSNEYDVITWSTGATDSSIVVTTPNTYSVKVENICGTDTASIVVDAWQVEIPNVITPNGDFKNDFFFIDGLDDGQWELSIKSRWGDEVYFNPDYENTFSGERLSDGVYYYQLLEDSECNVYNGWVFITR